MEQANFGQAVHEVTCCFDHLQKGYLISCIEHMGNLNEKRPDFPNYILLTQLLDRWSPSLMFINSFASRILRMCGAPVLWGRYQGHIVSLKISVVLRFPNLTTKGCAYPPTKLTNAFILSKNEQSLLNFTARTWNFLTITIAEFELPQHLQALHEATGLYSKYRTSFLLLKPSARHLGDDTYPVVQS